MLYSKKTALNGSTPFLPSLCFLLNIYMKTLLKNPNIFYAENEEQFWSIAKEDLCLTIREAVQARGICRLGLAGGKTPQKLYQDLAKEKLPWDKVECVVLDERYVPSDHPESNLKMLRENLLNQLPLSPRHLWSFDTTLTPQEAAEEMNRKLDREISKNSPSDQVFFDLLVLGAGEDGHIASLFEGDTALYSQNWAAVGFAKGHPIEIRLTLTLKTLEHSRRGLLLLKGKAKKPVLDALLQNSSFPALPTPDLPLPAFTALRHLLNHFPVKLIVLL